MQIRVTIGACWTVCGPSAVIAERPGALLLSSWPGLRPYTPVQDTGQGRCASHVGPEGGGGSAASFTAGRGFLGKVRFNTESFVLPGP